MSVSEQSDQPITFWGKTLTADKSSLNNFRVQSAQVTWARLEPVMKSAGIVRLADITGLDRLGIPVMLAIRPNSRGIAVNSGKGTDLLTAKLTAVAEGIERHLAGEVLPDICRTSYYDMEKQHVLLPSASLPLRRGAHFNHDWPHDWILGWDILGNEPVAVPFSMVRLSRSFHLYDFPIFETSSVGLAAGSHLLEAILEGLLEIMEYGSLTQAHEATNLDWRSLPFLRFQLLAERLTSRGINVVVSEYSSAGSAPIFEVILQDREISSMGIYAGHAAHLDQEIALVKALLEAAQSRAVYIAGSRDDMSYMNFHILKSRSIDPGGAPRPLGSLHAQSISSGTRTLQGDIRLVTDLLQQRGVKQIVIVDLSSAEFPLSVIKAIVPGLRRSQRGPSSKAAGKGDVDQGPSQ